LQRRRAKFERTAGLAELAEAELKSPLQLRKLENLVEHIGFQVAEALEPALTARFATLPPNEAEAAILAVVDVLGKADLSDRALLADDADPEKPARRLRARFPDRPRAVALAEQAWPLYEFATLSLHDPDVPALADAAPIHRIRYLQIYSPHGDDVTRWVARTFPDLPSLALTNVDAEVDLAPLLDLPLNQLQLAAVPAGLNLAPLADRSLQLFLTRADFFTGIEELGPQVEIRYLT